MKHIAEIFKVYPELSEEFIKFLYKKNNSCIYEILMSTEESTNLIYKNLIVSAININFEYRDIEIKAYLEKEIKSEDVIKLNEENDCPIVIELLDFLLSLIPTEISKNWQRLCAYCEVNNI